MRIDRLEVKNFKGFEHKIIDFSPQFNVLTGDNGSGKTAVLDALAVGIGALLLGFDGINTRPIRDHEVRQVSDTKSQRTKHHKQYPVEVHCLGTIRDSETISWKRRINTTTGRTTRQNANEYSTARLWLQKKEKVKTVKRASSTIGYIDCLETANAEKVLMAWIKTMTIAERQRKTPVDLLEGLKEAVKNGLKEERCEDVYFDVETDGLLVTFTNGKILPYHFLSDGLRNMLLMIADIAYRAGELNSHLGKRAVLETPGVVLIDELDLYLHPNWQRRVVNNLRETFPKIQFITTTHSPFIIQSMPKGELIDLNEHEQAANCEL